MRPYWLSIDWDFFCPDPPDAPAPKESPKARNGAWDDRPRDWSPQTVGVAGFLAKLQGDGLDFRGAGLRVSDTHRLAYNTFRPWPSPATVLHFDAHHDLGYPETFWSYLRCGRDIDCGNWLWAVLAEDPDVDVRVIFPEWKGAQDWLRTPPSKMSWLQPMSKRVSFSTWPVDIKPGEVDVIHLARSGAWSAPWHDEEWLSLVAAFEDATGNKAHAYGMEREDVLAPRLLSKSRASRIE